MGLLLLSGCATKVLNGPVATFTAQDLAAQLQAGPGLELAGAGLFTELMRAHVIDAVVQNPPAEVQTKCGAALWGLLVRAGRRMPGL